MRRWLLLLLGGTLAFGLFCFGSGLLLGIYLGGGSVVPIAGVSPDASPRLAEKQQAPVVPGTPTTVLPVPPPAALQPGSAQAGAPAASTPSSAPTASIAPSAALTTPAAPAAALGAATATGQSAGSPAAGTTSGGVPVAQDALPVQRVTDLLVGLPADEDETSPLRGQLVSAAVRDQVTQAQPNQPAQKQPDQAALKQPAASGQTPGVGSTVSTAGTNTAASSGTAGTAAAKPAPSSGGASAASGRVFGIRVGAYLDPAAAQRRAETLSNHGYHPLILSSMQAEEGLAWYSVVLNPGKDLSSVRREAARFAQEQGQQPDVVSWIATPGADAGVSGAARP